MSPEPLALAAAAERLRRKPGRPRKAPPEPLDGHNMGTTVAGSRIRSGDSRGALASDASALLAPRLLDVRRAAAYLGLGVWTVRDLVATGVLPRVIVPRRNGNDLRKVLLDRQDLDGLIERWKEPVR